MNTFAQVLRSMIVLPLPLLFLSSCQSGAPTSGSEPGSSSLLPPEVQERIQRSRQFSHVEPVSPSPDKPAYRYPTPQQVLATAPQGPVGPITRAGGGSPLAKAQQGVTWGAGLPWLTAFSPDNGVLSKALVTIKIDGSVPQSLREIVEPALVGACNEYNTVKNAGQSTYYHNNTAYRYVADSQDYADVTVTTPRAPGMCEKNCEGMIAVTESSLLYNAGSLPMELQVLSDGQFFLASTSHSVRVMILAHEMGHVLGLDDEYFLTGDRNAMTHIPRTAGKDPASVMMNVLDGRSLSVNDIAALEYLYPTPLAMLEGLDLNMKSSTFSPTAKTDDVTYWLGPEWQYNESQNPSKHWSYRQNQTWYPSTTENLFVHGWHLDQFNSCMTGTAKVSDAARSDKVDDGATVCFGIKSVNRSGLIFDYKVSSEKNWDFLDVWVCEIGGSYQQQQVVHVSGTDRGWQTYFTASLDPSKSYWVWFCYTKDGSVSQGEDCAWVDWVCSF